MGHKACRDNRSVLYQRVPKLFTDLTLARGDGRYSRILLSLAGVQLRAHLTDTSEKNTHASEAPNPGDIIS